MGVMDNAIDHGNHVLGQVDQVRQVIAPLLVRVLIGNAGNRAEATVGGNVNNKLQAEVLRSDGDGRSWRRFANSTFVFRVCQGAKAVGQSRQSHSTSK